MKSTSTANPVLTQTAIEYANEPGSGFIGMKLFPPFFSNLQSAEYYVMDEENAVNFPDNIDRAPGDEYKTIQMQLSSDTYVCKDKGVQTPVDDTERSKYASAFDADLAATRRVTASVLYNHELAVKAQLEASTPTSAATASFATATVKQIRTDIDAAKEAIRLGCGMLPNVATMTLPVYNALLNNTNVADQIKYTVAMGVMESRQRMADFLGVARLEIADGVHNTANAGQTVSVGDIWGAEVYLAVVTPSQDLAAMNHGRTFLWTEQTGGSELQIDTYRKDANLSDFVRCRQYSGIKVVGAKAGYRLTGALG